MKNKQKFNTPTELIGTKSYNPNGYTILDSALAFLTFTVLFFVAGIGLSRLFSFLWKSKIITDYYLLMIVNITCSQLLILAIAFAFSKIRSVNLFSGSGYKYKFDTIDVLFGIVLIIGVLLLFSSTHYQFVDDYTHLTFGMPYDEYSITIGSQPEGATIYALILLVITPLFPAICEEVLYRGIVLRGLEGLGGFVSVLLTSAMFMLMHGNFEQVILQFIGGLAITAVVYITKNFFVGAAMHFANNLFATFSEAIKLSMEDIIPFGSYLVDAIYIVFGIVMVIVGVFYFSKKVLANYKIELLGKKKQSLDKPIYAYVSNPSELENGNYQKIDRNDIDYETLKNSDGTLFLYRRKFCKLNKPKYKKSGIVLLTISIILSIVSLVLSIF